MSRIGWRTLARYLAGESPPAEADGVRRWAESDPHHAELLEGARRAWLAAELEPAEWDASAAWRTMAGRLDAAPASETRSPVRARRNVPGAWRWAVAAAAVVAVALPLFLLRGVDDGGTTYVTGANERITVRLADGSVARLAPDTRLRVAPDGAREAWLEGTAFFGIAEMNGQPFVVHTPAGDARVLGTRFELRAETDRVQLAVLEGRVALDGAGGQQVVEAGEVSLAQVGDAPSAPRAADVQEMVEWMGDVLIFQDTPLRQAALEIERKFDVRVRIADAALADRTLTAAFEGQELATVVATVCRVVDARCQVQDSVVVVQP